MNTEEVLEEITTNADNKRGSGKAGAIRRAFQILPEAKPSEIVDYLQREHNIEVTGAYVSVIKGQLARKAFNLSFESLRIAKKLISACGSVEVAKRAIDAVLEEQERTSSLTNFYSEQMTEIDLRLEDEDQPLDQTEKRDLMNQKKRLQKLLDALQEI